MIKTYRCIPVLSKLFCPKCKIEMVVRNKIAIIGDPGLYDYDCHLCGHHEKHATKYPSLDFVTEQEIPNPIPNVEK